MQNSLVAPLLGAYNFSLDKYVVGKTLDGLFLTLGEEELARSRRVRSFAGAELNTQRLALLALALKERTSKQLNGVRENLTTLLVVVDRSPYKGPARADHHRGPEKNLQLEAGYIYADCSSPQPTPPVTRRTIHYRSLGFCTRSGAEATPNERYADLSPLMG